MSKITKIEGNTSIRIKDGLIVITQPYGNNIAIDVNNMTTFENGVLVEALLQIQEQTR